VDVPGILQAAVLGIVAFVLGHPFEDKADKLPPFHAIHFEVPAELIEQNVDPPDILKEADTGIVAVILGPQVKHEAELIATISRHIEVLAELNVDVPGILQAGDTGIVTNHYRSVLKSNRKQKLLAVISRNLRYQQNLLSQLRMFQVFSKQRMQVLLQIIIGPQVKQEAEPVATFHLFCGTW
jgi:hypothetical protein